MSSKLKIKGIQDTFPRITARKTGYGDEYRVTLRLGYIKQLRPDYTHKQALDRAESLAAYCDGPAEAACAAANLDLISCLVDEEVRDA